MEITNAELNKWMDIIKTFPEALQNEIEALSDNLLDTPYREGGWTLR
ncbi:hypothetical protein [Aequorivita aurantiaca]